MTLLFRRWDFLLMSNGIEWEVCSLHAPSIGHDICICSGIEQAFQCGETPLGGTKVKMRNVCMWNRIIFFALYFAFQILLDGAALQLHTIQDSSTSER